MSYTTQTLSCAEEETDFTVYLSPFAKHRLAAWRRGELKDEKPPTESIIPRWTLPQNQAEKRNRDAAPAIVEAYGRLKNITHVSKELRLPLTSVRNVLIRNGIVKTRPNARSNR